MIAIRSIVVATDLSAPARRAVERAAMLAKRAGAPLALVQAVSGSALDELRRWLDGSGDVQHSIVEDARLRLHELATAVAARHAIDVVDRTTTGRSVEEIARVADERDADLIVTGTLGAGLLRHHLIGSTAERVVKKSARPVLMVRQSVHESYRRVLVPLDFSAWSAPSLDIGVAVAPDAHFTLVHCIEIPFEGRLRLAGVDDAVVERCRSVARADAERQMAQKRADYFAAGTLVVWDVDLESEAVVRVYRVTAPGDPTVYHRGQLAEAEPALPGWTMPVDDLFPTEHES